MPGQWLRDQLDDVTVDMAMRFAFPLAVPAIWLPVHLFGAIFGAGWPTPGQILFEVSCWLLLVGIFWREAWQLRARFRSLRLGMLAEQMVGQQLERCRTAGYHVFHDIPRQGAAKPFNIDHLVIGPGGVFVVETKARSKPDNGETVAWVQGNTVQFSDASYDPDAIRQAGAIADHVGRMLAELIGESATLCQTFTPGQALPIQAVPVYPGWYIDRNRGDWHDVLLTNQEGVVGFIRKSKSRLSDQEAKRIGLIVGRQLQQGRRELVEH